MRSKAFHIKHVLAQILGVTCGGLLMYVIAIYEDKIEDVLY